MATKKLTTTGSNQAVKKFYNKNKLIINGVVIVVGAYFLQKTIRKWINAGRAWKMNPNNNVNTTIDVNGQQVAIEINLYRKADEFYNACWNYAYGTMEDEDTMLKVVLSVPCNLMPQLAYIYASTYGENLITDVKSYMPNSYIQQCVTHCPSFFN